MGVAVSGGFRKLDSEKLAAAIERSLDTVGIMLEGEVISRANENVDTGRQLHFHRKCGILWNRYRVQKFGRLNTHYSYPLTQKQIITPLSRKMWHFVEKIPGTAISLL